MKSELADHRVTLNFDVNIPSTRINGAEAELTARPISNLTLGAGIGYTDATVNDDTAGPYTRRSGSERATRRESQCNIVHAYRFRSPLHYSPHCVVGDWLRGRPGF